MPVVTHALIHRARVVKAQRSSTRNAQGEYETTQVYGPWFPARRMTRQPGRESREDSGYARAPVVYSLMWGTAYEDGSAIEPPLPSQRVEVEVYGQRELWEINGDPLRFDSGTHVFGGQAVLARVNDST